METLSKLRYLVVRDGVSVRQARPFRHSLVRFLSIAPAWGRHKKTAAVEDATKEEFFGSPRSDRAQLFLSKILSH